MDRMEAFRTSALLFCFLGMYGLHVEAITCWECDNVMSEKECQLKGEAAKCLPSQNMCQIELRRGGWGKRSMIKKSCKTLTSCGSNHVQNKLHAWAYQGEMIQCNGYYPSSVCRCCCSGDLCNYRTLKCTKQESAGECPRLRKLRNGWMTCTLENRPLSTCYFGCHRGYYLTGPRELKCDYFGKWSGEQPSCRLITCPLPRPLSIRYGSAWCTWGENLGSRCFFTCEEGYRLHGARVVQCIDDRNGDGRGVWTRPMPLCLPLQCDALRGVNHGTIQCTDENYVGSECSFECDVSANFTLYPADAPPVTCLRDETWNVPSPCCNLPCPPFAVMDFIVVLDSSSSVGEENWNTMKAFVKGFLEVFAIRDDASRFGCIRYNEEVDTSTQILLSDYPNDKTEFFHAFENITYDGIGTNTGRALDYITDVLLKDGNRPEAKDVVLLITDGRSQDDVKHAAERLRAAPALVYVIPVKSHDGSLDMEQVETITGNEENIIRDAMHEGFSALDKTFSAKISELLCLNPCEHPFDEHF